jgi:two-component system, LuxR family, response regulator FixJ
MSHIHIIDPDLRRRATVARTILEIGFHAEIYEDFSEFSERAPREGLVLAAPSEAPSFLSMVRLGQIELPVVVFSEQPDTRQVVEAIQAGALDYLDWPVDRQYLAWVIGRAFDAGNRLAAQTRKRSAARKLINLLSTRELEVLLLVIAGGSNKSIAGELGISPRTVEIHRGNMMRKLKAESASDAVRIALYAGLDDRLEIAA